MACCGETQGIGGSSGVSDVGGSSGVNGTGKADASAFVNALLEALGSNTPLASNSGTGSGGSGAGPKAIEFS
jgi:hypothetical protein